MVNKSYICPICLGKMTATKRAYSFKETFLGFYDAVDCSVCGSHFFTEKALKAINQDYILYKQAKIIAEPFVTILESSSRTKDIIVVNIAEDTNKKVISNIDASVLGEDGLVSENKFPIIKEAEIMVTNNAAE